MLGVNIMDTISEAIMHKRSKTLTTNFKVKYTPKYAEIVKLLYIKNSRISRNGGLDNFA